MIVMAGEKPSLSFAKYIFEKILDLFGKTKDEKIKNPLSPAINELENEITETQNVFIKYFRKIKN
jgi:hypothetical protein